MGYAAHLKDIVTVVSILSLFVTGVLITLKSGEVTVGGDQGPLVVGNLSRLLLTVAGCLLFLSMVQQIIGFRLGLN